MQFRNPIPGVDIDVVRLRKREATTRFLGRTISISDEDWQLPSLLPGWTRAHVATHVARNADAMRSAVDGIRLGKPYPVYGPEKYCEIERGSERTALNLQIDLDMSASRFNEALDLISPEQWDELVEIPREGVFCPISLLPLARLAEVELHHVDLDRGYTIDDIEPETSWWLICWLLQRHEMRGDMPNLLLIDEHGHSAKIGDGSERTVTGMRSHLLAWVSGRGTAGVVGAEDIQVLPL